ncbi:hypothetical protein CRG98_045960 [Punica granatum]|uniref:Uncharacterized protein n=1 Tax=Punica granatum TaxID=22663 RepID=A0A2I0HPL2_PUNGR|nr:hypothetical protein CRG98_045960 [Punica granatum]
MGANLVGLSCRPQPPKEVTVAKVCPAPQLFSRERRGKGRWFRGLEGGGGVHRGSLVNTDDLPWEGGEGKVVGGGGPPEATVLDRH